MTQLNIARFFIILHNSFLLDWSKQYLLSKTHMVKYNINTKHERDSETRCPYINPSPCNKAYWIRRVYIKQNKVYLL